MAVSGTSNLMTKPEVDARLGYIQGKLESMANYYSNKKHNDALADQIAGARLKLARLPFNSGTSHHRSLAHR